MPYALVNFNKVVSPAPKDIDKYGGKFSLIPNSFAYFCIMCGLEYFFKKSFTIFISTRKYSAIL